MLYSYVPTYEFHYYYIRNILYTGITKGEYFLFFEFKQKWYTPRKRWVKRSFSELLMVSQFYIKSFHFKHIVHILLRIVWICSYFSCLVRQWVKCNCIDYIMIHKHPPSKQDSKNKLQLQLHEDTKKKLYYPIVRFLFFYFNSFLLFDTYLLLRWFIVD